MPVKGSGVATWDRETGEPSDPFWRKAWQAWRAMKNRCLRTKNENFARYGGRGIAFDPRWESFASFVEDVGLPPALGRKCSLDREHNEKGYGPGNVRWTTARIQGNNRSNNRRIEFNGETHTVAEWAFKLELSRNTLLSRLKRWPLARALSDSKRVYRKGA